jgi:hypothetical protein
MNHTPSQSNSGNTGGSPQQPRIFIVSQRESNLQDLLDFGLSLRQRSTESLVKSYNQNYQKGSFGVNAQSVFILALHREFLDRFGKSPMTFEHDCVVTLPQFITIDGSSWALVYDKT